MNPCELDNTQQGGLSILPPAVQSRKAAILFWLLLAGLTVSMAAAALHSRAYLGNNDAFYYLAIADNWLENGKFLNAVTIPDGPIITPQNGIVAFFYMLRMLSLSKHQCLLAVAGFNFLLLLSCFYPLIQICRSVGLQSRLLLAGILLVFVGSLRIFMWLYLSPVNDMVFYTGQLWLLFLLILILQRQDATGSNPVSYYLMNVGAVALAAILIHFRLNIVFVPLGGIAAAILTRRFRLLPLMTVMVIAAVLSLAASRLIVDQYDFEHNTANIMSLFGNGLHELYVLFFRHVPESLFRDLRQAGNLLYLPFYAALAVAFIQGVRRRNVMLLILAFMCIQMFGLMLLHGNMTERYLWTITIFMYILLFRVKVFRPIGVLFMAAVLINSAWTYGYQPPRMESWQVIAEQTDISRGDAFVVAMRQRECWYYTGKRSPYKGQYTWSQLQEALAVYIIGPRDHVDSQLSVIRDMAAANAARLGVRAIDYGAPKRADMLMYEVLINPAAAAEPTPL